MASILKSLRKKHPEGSTEAQVVRKIIDILNDGYPAGSKLTADEFKGATKKFDTDLEFVKFLHRRYVKHKHTSVSYASAQTSMKTTSVASASDAVLAIAKQFGKCNAESTVLDIGTEDCAFIESVRTKCFDGSAIIALNVGGLKGYGKDRDRSCIQLYDGVDIAVSVPHDHVDVVTAFMTIHHVKDPRGMFESLYTKLRSGSIVVVKEHDVPDENKTLGHLYDLLHHVYNLVHTPDRFNEKVFRDHYTRYMSRRALVAFMKTVGLKDVTSSEPLPKHLVTPSRVWRSYYAVFMKI
eukprot:jgi/Tetstr1/447300/TSEL_034737.t1